MPPMVDISNLTIDVFANAPIVCSGSYDYANERTRHLSAAMKEAVIAGHVIEFGVAGGTTITQIAKHFKKQIVYGFDSFDGLPEDWIVKSNAKIVKWRKGHFARNTLPSVPQNVHLVKGWFTDTLKPWVDNVLQGPIKDLLPLSFLHIDCDLYSSAKEVLTQLDDLIVPGTVIAFDEMFFWSSPGSYDMWHQGEYKALAEWMDENDRVIEPLYRSRYMQCSLKVVK